MDTSHRQMKMDYASPGTRLIAAIIDDAVVSILMAGLHLTGFVAFVAYESGIGLLLFYVAFAATFAVVPVYMVGMTAYQGQTIGKMAMSIKVVDSEGNKPSLGMALMRETWGKLVSATVLYIGFIAILLDEQRRGFGGTFVVKAQ